MWGFCSHYDECRFIKTQRQCEEAARVLGYTEPRVVALAGESGYEKRPPGCYLYQFNKVEWNANINSDEVMKNTPFICDCSRT